MQTQLPIPTPVSLLERLRTDGSGEAWTIFVRLYTPLLYAFVRRIHFESQEAADLIQDVFILLRKELPKFEYDPAKGQFRGWLKRIVIRKCNEGLRKKNVLNRTATLEDVVSFEENGVEVWVEEDFRKHVLRIAIQIMRAEFSEPIWKAFWEYGVQGRPVAEVAAELNLSINSVYQAKTRVLRRLQQEFKGMLD